MSTPWYLYIAQSASGKYYVGISTDVERRIIEHNKGQGGTLARIDGPFTLRYTSPSLSGQSQARSLEMQIKKWPRTKKIELIDGARALPHLSKETF